MVAFSFLNYVTLFWKFLKFQNFKIMTLSKYNYKTHSQSLLNQNLRKGKNRNSYVNIKWTDPKILLK